MYEFSSLDGFSGSKKLPADAMKINGEYIEDLVEGYEQLVVSGRSIMPQEVTYIETPSRDGGHGVKTHTKPRILTIQYKLEALTSNELREQYSVLNSVLRGVLEITFDDDIGWKYTGYLNSVDAPEENALSMVASFTIICVDPYAYSDVKTNNPVQLEYAQRITPDKITVRGSNVDNLKISNGTDELTIFGGHTTNDTIIIEWAKEEVFVTKNGNNALTSLSWLSVPEVFFLEKGTTITVSNGTLISIEWRDKKL